MRKAVFFLMALLSMPLMADESFGGIGVTIIPAKEGAKIVEVIPETPASEAGLLPADRIFKIDAGPVANKSFEVIKESLRGLSGKPVEISVIREADTLNFTMRRSVISVKTFSNQSVQDWYNTEKTEFSKEELEEVASFKGKSNESLAGVLTLGYMIPENSDALEYSAVFVEKENVFDKEIKKNDSAPLRGSAKLKAFSRTRIAFSANTSDNVRIRVSDAKGNVYLDKTVSANAGANTISFNGKYLPSDRYSITLEQNNSLSTYFAVLR